MTSKYELSESERETFVKKVLPTIFLGSFIWLISEILFGELFKVISLGASYTVFYIIILVLNANLFIGFYFLCRKGKNRPAICVYFSFAFTAGLLSVPIFVWLGPLSIYVTVYVSLAVWATALVLIAGRILGERFLATGHFRIYMLLAGLGVLLALIPLIFILQITNWIVLLICIIYLSVIVTIITIFGANQTKVIKEDYWVMITFRLLAFLLIFLVIVLIVVGIIIAIIAGGEGGSTDLSGLSFSSGGGKKKKEYEVQEGTIN